MLDPYSSQEFKQILNPRGTFSAYSYPIKLSNEKIFPRRQTRSEF